ncbi:polysaccharide pyruvyl transferase family protein [Aquimarina agarivorans]|uniref:polysaccharide pyruvyl transferase family protein n=1 Tax=Aquimarina agarivorans TaxID=980584 RepID=UPI000248EB2C|nr:polysaccharide pyruvyl transferase family protein [Aquimarina agarivorans]
MKESSVNLEKAKKLGQLIKDTLIPLVNNDYVLLDVPNHRNTGDNLIWEGELAFFKEISFKKIYGANHSCYDKEKIPKDSVIFLHGGGNFGDLYMSSQNLKLDIVKSFKKNRIIVFPQTVFYNKNENLLNDMKVFSSHPNLYMCVRDTVSYNLLKPFFGEDKLLLLPDMAFCLDFSDKVDKTNKGQILYIKRTDAELQSKFNMEKLFKEFKDNKVVISDWTSYSNNKFLNRLLLYKDEFLLRLSKVFLKSKLLSLFVDDEFGLNSKKNRKYFVDEGVKFINSYDLIITTRLHGLILSILLDKKIFLLDNSYGKNSNFFKTWLLDFEDIILRKDL